MTLTRYVAESPLRYPDFRVLWASAILTGIGYIGESVVLGWLLLEETDSPFVVGAGIALRALPNFLLGIPGGAVADRFDRRRLIRLVSDVTGLVSATLGLLALNDALGVGLILVGTFIGGCVRSLGQTARTSYAFDIVGPSRVVGGTALMNLGQRVGGIVGSLGVGAVLVGFGAGEAYLTLAAAHFASAAVLLLARTSGQSAPISRPPVWQGVREFIAEIGVNRVLALCVLLTAAVEVLGFSHQSVMPSIARDVLDVGPEGLGLLNAFGSAGGMIAILTVSIWGELQRKGRAFLIVLLAFGAAIVLLGVSGTFALALLAIALVAGLAALTDLLSQSLVQSAVANDLRGRAMGAWILAIGLGPVGHLQIGALAALTSVTAALVTNGLLLMLLAVGTMVAGRQVRRL
jgi:hypothetical protein